MNRSRTSSLRYRRTIKMSIETFLKTQIMRELVRQGFDNGVARQCAEAGVEEGKHYYGKDKFGHCFTLAGKRAEMAEPGKRAKKPK